MLMTVKTVLATVPRSLNNATCVISLPSFAVYWYHSSKMQ